MSKSDACLDFGVSSVLSCVGIVLSTGWMVKFCVITVPKWILIGSFLK